MFGNPTADYSGVAMGPCTCDACRVRFRARTGRDVPAQADAEYRAFMADSAREVAATIADLIHAKRPQAAFLTYIADHTDGIMSESNTAVGRPLPLWPYSASDNVRRALGSEPGKIAINLSMAFVDFPWRYAHVAGPEMQLRLYQNMAHGGPPAVAVVGTMAQADRTALAAATAGVRLAPGPRGSLRRPAATPRACCCWPPATRRRIAASSALLTEQHIPFEVATHVRGVTADPAPLRPRHRAGRDAGGARRLRPRRRARAGRRHVAADGAADRPGRRHGEDARLLADPRSHAAAEPERDRPAVRGRRLRRARADSTSPLLTLIPTAMFGPPEKVWSDKTETTVPGLVVAPHGRGRAAYIPWDVGGLYYRHSSPAHAALLTDVIDQLLPNGRQLRTSAHPLVEMTLMAQPARGRTLVHLVNGSGHHDTAYFAPIAMRDIRVELPGRCAGARRRAGARPAGDGVGWLDSGDAAQPGATSAGSSARTTPESIGPLRVVHVD